MRTIKSAREIEVLRANGRISAEAIRRAILATRQNGFEYEIEAEATYWMYRNGVQGNSFAPIVGSGPNVNVWHYATNGRQYKDGDLVVMDYGGALDYLGVDITRTWPVSGQFTPDQLKAYQCALEAQKAIIAAMTVGATRAQTREHWPGHLQEARLPGRRECRSLRGDDACTTWATAACPSSRAWSSRSSRSSRTRRSSCTCGSRTRCSSPRSGPEILTTGVPKEMDDVLALVREALKKNR